jgi:hypothetical protein
MESQSPRGEKGKRKILIGRSVPLDLLAMCDLAALPDSSDSEAGSVTIPEEEKVLTEIFRR